MTTSTLKRAAAISITLASLASAQTTLNAGALALRSSGAAAGGDWTLNANGYLGTYITLAQPGEVRLDLLASGVSDAGVAPKMNLVVGDARSAFDVAAGFNTYSSTISLPAGTHFVRAEYANDHPSAAARQLTLRNLSVTGATVSNNDTSANALAAADTYVDHFRRGDVRVTLAGPGGVPLLEGTAVNAKMVRNAFHFGGTVSGSTLNDSKDMLGNANPPAGSEAAKFQAFVKKNFNTIVGSNAGKWSNNESTAGNVNMSLVDRQLNFAVANDKHSRMHTLIWGNGTAGGMQQPAYVNNLISQAAAGNATAKANLRTAISNRIAYYAGTAGNRSQKYVEVDGLNESLHHPSYWNIFGAAGMADIYNELNAAIAAAGSEAKTYLNEWNILQYSPASVSASGTAAGFDPYANYYRQHVDDLVAAGGNLGGIGIQYYANYTQTGIHAPSAANIQKALQNLSVTGLPISMTEFGGASSMTKSHSNAGAAVLEETLRMFYGTPDATTFMIWGWWDLSGAAYPPAAMLDNTNGNNTLTPMGQRWEQMMALWSTDVTPAVDADGRLSFNGFWGDYNIGGQTGFSNLTLEKGTTDYVLELAAPPTWSLWKPTMGGDWMTATNWTNNTPAGGAGTTAHFAPAAAARTITLTTDLTLGQINFDGTSPYTLAGAGSITLDATGEAALNVIAGSHAVDLPLMLARDARVVVMRPDSALTLRQFGASSAHRLTKKGPGTLAVDRVELSVLAIDAGKVVSLDPTALNTVGQLSLAQGATLDIGHSTWRVDLESETTTAQIREWIAAARNGGTWDGAGITSSLAAGDARYAVGYVEGDAGLFFRATFGGDATLDGLVSFDDLLVLAQHYGKTSGASWADGDANYDGVVDFADLLILAQNYGGGDPSLAEAVEAGLNDSFIADWRLAVALVPEPSSLMMLLFAMMSRGSR